MTTPNTTLKRQRIQAMVDQRLYQQVTQLAKQEIRSESSMAAILIEEAIKNREALNTDSKQAVC
ncbi:MAG: hypothetical protein AXW15_05810 [Neptuniibacter sp. Phe_28]|jgi:hypothetical protein|nr:MAG: hypothetical protein AXW15_05810 [Neptuniibacter sp. Phe_28]